MQISKEIFCPAKNINRLAELDKFLQDVKVADLAVGSGAFPLGMLNEITKAREVLTAYLNLGKSEKISRSLYDLKIETIKNSIFACDIEPSAVDIAKLRLWLSIVIEDEPTADKNNFTPKPLPNLDCNIICGNSLIDEFEGVQLIKHSEILNNADDGEYQTSLLQNEVDLRIKELIRLQKNLFHESNHERKEECRRYIRAIYDEIILEQLGKKSKLAKKYSLAANQKSLPFILWQLYFPTVFKDNGGFDIIIGNPPYIDSETMTKNMPKLREICSKKFKSAKGNWDYFVLFIEQGLNLLKPQGVLSMIVPNKIISAPYAEAIRAMIIQNNVQEIRDYSNVSVFENAAVYPVVIRVEKPAPKKDVLMVVMSEIDTLKSSRAVNAEIFCSGTDWDIYFDSNDETFGIIQKMKRFPLLEEIAKVNGAATVGEAYKVKEFLQDKNSISSTTLKFINTGGIDKYKSCHGISYTRYLKDKYLYPCVEISDLKNMSQKRLQESLSEKIIIGGMNIFIECFYDVGEYLAGKSTTIVYDHPNLKFITAVLNSTLMSFYYQKIYNSMSLAGGYYRIGVPQIKKLPIAIPKDNSLIKKVESKVENLQKICRDNPENNLVIEKILLEVDDIIYNLYDLTAEEINFIKNFELEIGMSGAEN